MTPDISQASTSGSHTLIRAAGYRLALPLTFAFGLVMFVSGCEDTPNSQHDTGPEDAGHELLEPGLCGDGIVDDGEECDDISGDPHSLCHDCRLVAPGYCGNGEIDGYEECDDGNTDPDDGCHQCRTWSPASGQPLLLPDTNHWQWFPIEDTLCREGGQAGISINPGTDTSKLMFFFEGGGACFEPLNCTQNPHEITEGRRTPAPTGIFDRNDVRNPYRDWTWIYLPYCSGDVFVGDSPNTIVDGLANPQQFVGDANMRAFLDRIVPTFSDVEHVSSVGISAGGISALVNAQRLAREFPDARVTILDDGGPPLDNDLVAPCLQRWWVDLWNLANTALADCGADCRDEGNILTEFLLDTLDRDDIDFGLFSFKEDAVVRLLFSFGTGECTRGPIPGITAHAFAESLERFRTTHGEAFGNFATFYAPGSSHVCVTSGCFYNTEVEGTALYEWTANLLSGTVTHIGD